MKTFEHDAAIEAGHRIASAELSLRPRVAHAALLVAGLAGTVVATSLWVTEPDLPLRTLAAFVAMSLIGLAWVGYAAWVLTARRVLYARQRVVAGWLALLFTSIFTVCAFLTGFVGKAPAAFAAGAMGLGLVGIALTLLLRARQKLATLLARKHALEISAACRPK